MKVYYDPKKMCQPVSPHLYNIKMVDKTDDIHPTYQSLGLSLVEDTTSIVFFYDDGHLFQANRVSSTDHIKKEV